MAILMNRGPGPTAMKVVGVALALAMAFSGCLTSGDKDDEEEEDDEKEDLAVLLATIKEECPDPPEDCYAAIAAYLELDDADAGPVSATATVYAETNATQNGFATTGSMIVKVTGPTVGDGGTFTVTPQAMANVTWETAFQTGSYEDTGESMYLVFPFTSTMDRKDIEPMFTLDVDDTAGDFTATARAGNPYVPGALDSEN